MYFCAAACLEYILHGKRRPTRASSYAYTHGYLVSNAFGLRADALVSANFFAVSLTILTFSISVVYLIMSALMLHRGIIYSVI